MARTNRSPGIRTTWRRIRILVVMLACISGLAACQGQQYDVDLVMTPSTAGACEVPVAVDIHWDASRLGLKEAYLEFGSLGRPVQRWHTGDSRGSDRTGVWVTDGTTVTLKAMNGVVLAKRTFTTTVCPDKDWL